MRCKTPEARELGAGRGSSKVTDVLLELERALAARIIHVHGRLQLRERELLSQIEQKELENDALLEGVQAELTSSLADLEEAMRLAHVAALPDNMPTSNLAEVHSRLSQAMAVPVHLVQMQGNADVGLILDEDTYNKIDDLLKLKLESDIGYRLLKDDELPADYVLPDLSEKSLTDFDPWEQDSASDVGNNSLVSESFQPSTSLSQISNSSSSSTISNVSSHPIMVPAGKPLSKPKRKSSYDPKDGLDIGKTVQVKICHVTSPLDFYVIRKSSLETLSELNANIQEVSRHCPSPKNVKINQIYLLMDECNEWNRVRVTSQKSTDKFVVVSIDHGNTSTVEIFRLKELPRKLTSVPAQAVRCALRDIHSSGEGNWKQSTFTEILAKLDGKFIQMHILGINVDKFQVDLSYNDPMCHISSVRDALLYFGDGSFLRNDSPTWSDPPRSCKEYLPGRELEVNSSLSVVITHFNSPSSFYCVPCEDISHHNDLLKKIECHLKYIKTKISIYKPRVGMPCLATYEDIWYRGIIEDIEPNHVLVRFVDFGNQSTLTWKGVRDIPDDLLKLPQLSIHCALSGIAPIEEENLWTQLAKDVVVQWVRDERCLINVTGHSTESSGSDKIHQVTLICPNLQINVNEALVEMALAKSTGPRSRLVDDVNMKEAGKLSGAMEGSESELSMDCIDQHNDTMESQESFSEVRQIKHSFNRGHTECVPTNGMMHPEMLESDILTSKEESSCSEEENQQCHVATATSKNYRFRRNNDVATSRKARSTDISALNATCHSKNSENKEKSPQSRLDNVRNSDGPVRIQVEILTALSPACIFIRVKNIADKIERLSAEMQLYYNLAPAKEEDCWEPKERDRCAVKSPKDFQWYRGLILEVLACSKYKVILKDFGRTEIISKENLRELFPKFATVPDGCIKCHLANLKIAGPQPSDSLTKQTWSAFACEELNRLLKDHSLNLFISKQGQIDKEEKSLPVELWVRDSVGSALQASKTCWFTVNKKLVENGCALPIDWKLMSEEDTFLSNNDLDVLNPSDDPDRTMLEWLEETAQDSSFSSSDDSDEIKKTLTHLGDWLPPLPLPPDTFQALPTYVDYDCNIFLHELSDPTNGSVHVLRKITKSLFKKFNGSRPTPEDSFWLPNNLCVAQYHLDKRWYRGKVLQITSDNLVEVQFADYGNVEKCRPTDLRKNIICRKIPAVARKCRVPGLTPISEDGKWPIPILDFIHGTLVDNECTVKVIRTPIPLDNVYEIDIIIQNRSIIELLLEQKFATYTPVNFTFVPEPQCHNSEDDLDVLVLEESGGSLSCQHPANKGKQGFRKQEKTSKILEQENLASETNGEIVSASAMPAFGRGKKLTKSYNNEAMQTSEPTLDGKVSSETKSNETKTGKISVVPIPSFGRGKKLKAVGSGNSSDSNEASSTAMELSASVFPALGRGKNFSTFASQIQAQPSSLKFVPFIPTCNDVSSKNPDTSLVMQMYKPAVLPKSDRWIVLVQSVLGPTEVVIFIKEVPEETQWNSYDSYQKMFNEMQDEAALQSPLSNITLGSPCCVLCDGLWYRGKVKTINKTNINVEKVDSRDEECVATANIRSIAKKWLKEPILGFECKLNCDLVPGNDALITSERMLALMIHKNLEAVVVHRDPLTVNLFSNATEGRLVYQELLDEGVLVQK
ncbi:Tudor domain-containing protein 1 [Frankliniella fusca]|uniref:Tudor domain-containing protein 1 n=1 Tax=Frankliniella fusca TaxID=407009 RepID=A0AAE1HME6_9NEOP|nr:Tudor domain-containing protein 1 [Frankliniella fusca]